MSNFYLSGTGGPYTGTKANMPPNMYRFPRLPLGTDTNYSLGDFWVYNDPDPSSNSQQIFYLASLKGNADSAGPVALWREVGAGGGESLVQLTAEDGNVALPVAGNINIVGGPTGTNPIFNINTTTINDSDTIGVNLNNSIVLPATTADATSGVIALGTNLENDRFIHNYGAGGATEDNTFVGRQSGNFTSAGLGSNSGFGNNTLNALTSGHGNCAISGFSLSNLTSGASNVAVGLSSLSDLTTGNLSVAVGSNSLGQSLDGNGNIAIGYEAGYLFTTNESNNICIGNEGVVLDNGTIRIGTAGTHNLAYVSGITGTTINNPTTNTVVNVGTDGQLGQTLFTSTGATLAITQPTAATINFEVIESGSGGALTPANFGANFSQPFLVYQVGNATNVTGDGTIYMLGTAAAFSGIAYNVGSNFSPGNGAGTACSFTAPATGYYKFVTVFQLQLSGPGSITTSAIHIYINGLSNPNYRINASNGLIGLVPDQKPIPLDYLDVVTFGVQINTSAPALNWSVIQQGVYLGVLIRTYIYGYRIG